MRKIYVSLLGFLLGAAGLSNSALSQDSMTLANTVVNAADRSPEDRALDAGRKPAELLAFLGVQPGWRVADLGAGRGYTTELLQRAVGSDGVVYGQNSKLLLEKFLEKPWSARLAKPVMKGTVRLDRDFDDPFPDDLHSLDAVTMVLFYHDTVWLAVNREAMNKAVFAALKPGGVFLIVYHSARAGDGANVTATLHRIEEDVVKTEVQAAGFVLEGSRFPAQ
jgi:predicted methyltransferase